MVKRGRMIVLMLLLWNVAAPVDGQMGGVYCDEVVETLLEYQEETGAFTEEQLEDLIGGCAGWEERKAEIEAAAAK